MSQLSFEVLKLDVKMRYYKHLIFLLLLIPVFSMASPLIDQNLSTLMEETESDQFISVTIGFNNWINTAQLQNEAKKFDRIKRREYTINRLKENYKNEAGDVLRWLENEEAKGNVTRIKKLWIAHVCAVQIKNDLLEELFEFPEVYRVRQDKSWPIEEVIDDYDSEDQGEITTAELDEISWGVNYIGAPALWEQGFYGDNILVAVMDTGCDLDHPDLMDHFWVNPGEIPDNNIDDDGNGYIDDIHGWNFYNDNNNVDDYYSTGHGTKSAGVALGDGTDGNNTGVAPNASLMALRNYPDSDSPESTWIEAFQYATMMGVDVITVSMSFPTAGNPDMVSLRTADANMLAAGVLHSNSPGNSRNAGIIPYNVYAPANDPPPFLHPEQEITGGLSAVIGVGMFTSSGTIHSYSPLGPSAWENPEFPEEFQDYPYNDGEFAGLKKVDLVAPCSVLSTARGGGYTNFTGTSSATPHVGGSLALLKSIHQQATPAELTEAILMTAEDAGDPGVDSVYGCGRLRVDLAHDYLDEMFEYGGLTLSLLDNDENPVANAKYFLNGGVVVGNVVDGLGENARILPGTYEMEIRADGYVNYVYPNLAISAGGNSDLVIHIEQQETLFTPSEISGEIEQDAQYLVDIQISGITGQTEDTNYSISLEPQTTVDWIEEVEIDPLETFTPYGVVMLDTFVIVAGVNAVDDAQFWTYSLNTQERISTVDQPAQLGENGTDDMASDGEFIYAPDRGKVYKLNREFTVVDTINFSETITEIAGIAFDEENQVFYLSSETDNDEVYKGSLDGQILETITFAHTPTGLAYNPDDKDGAFLYSLFNDYSGQAKLVRYDLTNEYYLGNFYIDPQSGWGAIGLDIAKYMGSPNWHLLTAQDNTTIKVYHREINSEVVSIASEVTVSPEGGSVSFELFPSLFWLDTDVDFYILFDNEMEGWTYRMPVNVRIVEESFVSGENELIPDEMTLYSPYPNPFNPSVNLEFSIPQTADVEFYVVNLLGQRVTTLIHGKMEAGRHMMSWNGSNYAAGMYLAVLKSGNYTQVKKLLLIK